MFIDEELIGGKKKINPILLDFWMNDEEDTFQNIKINENNISKNYTKLNTIKGINKKFNKS